MTLLLKLIFSSVAKADFGIMFMTFGFLTPESFKLFDFRLLGFQKQIMCTEVDIYVIICLS